MHPADDSPEHHRERSDFIRTLVQREHKRTLPDNRYAHGTQKSIVQYWHNLQQVPSDVQDCIESWWRLTAAGFKHQLFDAHSARAFIGRTLDTRHEQAFAQCYHPAMQADYFRLCYLFAEGGLYVDADDVFVSNEIEFLFDDGRLKLQPLCYDLDAAMMVKPGSFIRECAHAKNWVYYFNNNPLCAGTGHPVIERALKRATDLLQCADNAQLPEIQETTGPGNLSRTIFEMSADPAIDDGGMLVLPDWESIAISKWPLSYRSDMRNWRLSNRQAFVFKQVRGGP